MSETRVLVCGSRDWRDYQTVESMVFAVHSQCPNKMVVIHGGARGADHLAGQAAARFNIGVEVFPAQWNLYGRSAGPVRNVEMLESGVDLVVAFKDDFKGLTYPGGTEHMCRIAKAAGVPVWLIQHTDDDASGFTGGEL